MAFEKYASVDIKYSPLTEDMGVCFPSNFLCAPRRVLQVRELWLLRIVFGLMQA